MYDWIVEADVYRLRKAAGEASHAGERRQLEMLAEEKRATLVRRRSAVAERNGL